MRRLFLLFAFFFGIAPAAAVSAASKWGIDGEAEASFVAEVVDVLCVLTGDCPADCGGGRRQLGLKRTDGSVILSVKSNTLFAGSVLDLAPFCGRQIEVDGLLITRPGIVIYMLQRLRRPGDETWTDATAFARDWAARHGEDKVKKWFRKDPEVRSVISEFGKVGRPDIMPPPAQP